MKSLAFSKDAQRLLVAYRAGTLGQWDVSTGKLVPEIEDIPETLAIEEISGHGGRIVRIDPNENSRAELKEPTGVVTTLLDHGSSLRSLRLSPDGTRVAIADGSGAVHIVPVGSGASRPTLEGERKLTLAGAAIVRFSADGRMIAVGSDRGDTYVLDAATGTRLALLPGKSKVAQAEFSRAGDRLVTVSEDGLVRLWHVSLSPRALIEEARRLVPRCLAPEAREKVFLERTPPPWCVEMGKWPYQTAEWKQWLNSTRAGENPPLPGSLPPDPLRGVDSVGIGPPHSKIRMTLRPYRKEDIVTVPVMRKAEEVVGDSLYCRGRRRAFLRPACSCYAAGRPGWL